MKLFSVLMEAMVDMEEAVVHKSTGMEITGLWDVIFVAMIFRALKFQPIVVDHNVLKQQDALILHGQTIMVAPAG